MTKRIAILQNGLIRGGTERFVINLCRGLLEQQSKYEITVVNPSLIAEQQVLEPEVLATGARIEHTTTIVGIGGRLKHLWMLYKLLRRGHYDVFHTNLDLFNGPNLLIAWLARVPIRICHAHASMQETEIRGGRTIAIRVYQHLMRWMCWTFANRHIGCSDEANDFLYQGHDWRKANYPTVIYNGIDLDKYRRDKSSNGSMQQGCESSSLSNLNSEALNPLNGLQSIEPFKHSEALEQAKPLNPASAFEPIYILAIGRFVTQKNPYFIMDIMEHLQEMQPNIKLLWVGGGELYKDIESEIYDRKIDNITLLGWRDDIPALMQRSKLLLMPSLFEGLSITLIEAQAAGLPCLVSDTVTKQAQCGLIKYKSLEDGAESWAQEIISLLELLEPSEAFEPLELSEALSHFSIEYMAKQFEQVIQSYSLPKR